MSHEPGQYGTNDHRQWKTTPGKDHQDSIARMITFHEQEHTTINQTSVYGLLLLTYSQLSTNALRDKEKFQQIFRFLESNARVAHECGATLSGITLTLITDPRLSVEGLLERFPDYANYYEQGEKLVGGIPGYYLKRLVLLIAVGIAMQAERAGQTALSNPAGFSQADFRAIDLPDNRLASLIRSYDTDTILKLVERFLAGKDGNYDFIRTDLGFVSREDYTQWNGFAEINNELSLYLYDAFRKHFDSLRSPSYSFDGHLDFRGQFIRLLAAQGYIDTERSNDIFGGVSPYDADRYAIMTLETEAIRLTKQPLSCRVLFPAEVPPELRKQLLLGDDSGNLVLMFRDTSTLKGQYLFREESQRRWLEEEARTICFFRYILPIFGGNTVIIIPFETTGELEKFIREKPRLTALTGCISISAYYDHRWCAEHRAGMTELLDDLYYLNDVSLLYELEHEKPDQNHACYVFGLILDAAGVNATAIIQCTGVKNGIGKIIIVPGGEAFTNSAMEYIHQRYPHYQYRNFMTPQVYGRIRSVIASVYGQESEWYFRLSRY